NKAPSALASGAPGTVTGATEYLAGIASDHSALMPADLITLAHFSVSSAISLPSRRARPQARTGHRACPFSTNSNFESGKLSASVGSAQPNCGIREVVRPRRDR